MLFVTTILVKDMKGNKMPNLNSNSTFTTGKYKGQRVIDVYRRDKDYLIWLDSHTSYTVDFNDLHETCTLICCYDGLLDNLISNNKKTSELISTFSKNQEKAFGFPANSSTKHAWIDCLRHICITDAELQDIVIETRYSNTPLTLEQAKEKYVGLENLNKRFPGFGIIFEYGIINDDLKRPDVILLSKEIVIVMEFKQYEYDEHNRSPENQVLHYCYRLSDYHEGCRNKTIIPVVVYTGSDGEDLIDKYKDVNICGGDVLSKVLENLVSSALSDIGITEITRCTDEYLARWEQARYVPKVDLIREAKRIFNDEEHPRVRNYDHAIFPMDEMELVIDYSRRYRKHTIVFVTGIPGAGKTYFGLKLVHSNRNSNTLYVSGNTPLISVLHDELGDDHDNDVLVESVSKYLEHYLSDRTKTEVYRNILVFDEGQRIWNSDQMRRKYKRYNINESEADVLLDMQEKLDWSVFIVLIGDNQEINSGEEIGLGQWKRAILNSRINKNVDWGVICPPRIAPELNGTHILTPNRRLEFDASKFHLDKCQRSELSTQMGNFVNAIMDNKSQEELNGIFNTEGFLIDRTTKDSMTNYQMFVTRDLKEAKKYCVNNFDNGNLYGLITSSKGNLIRKQDGFIRRGNKYKTDEDKDEWFNYGQWYNGTGLEENSVVCRNFTVAVTEFGCQGLELSMPIIVWNNDMLRDEENNEWRVPDRWLSKRLVNNDELAFTYRINSYRVMLSRGKRGFIIYIPKEKELDSVYDYFRNYVGINELPIQP